MPEFFKHKNLFNSSFCQFFQRKFPFKILHRQLNVFYDNYHQNDYLNHLSDII